MILGIEIGGTKLQAVLGDASGRIERTERCTVPGEGTEPTCAALVELVGKLTGGAAVERIGIGFGGPVDAETGKVVLSHHVSGWSGFDLAGWAAKQFGAPCRIENDTNAAALAEARLGAGRGAGVVFYTNIGSGIGGGLVIEGKLYSRRFGAFEIGHTRLWDVAQGRYVIVEELCSGWSMQRMARRKAQAGRMAAVLELAGGDADAITCVHIGQAAAAGDASARALVEQAAGNFAIALCNMIVLVNPDRIVVGGGVPLMGEVFFAPLREAVKRLVFDIYADNYQILPAELGEAVVPAGALLIAGS